MLSAAGLVKANGETTSIGEDPQNVSVVGVCAPVFARDVRVSRSKLKISSASAGGKGDPSRGSLSRFFCILGILSLILPAS